MLDVVVRDKKGRLVRDLRPDEIQVFEDGARQEITDVRFVETGREPVARRPRRASRCARRPRRSRRQINLVTLLFDQLGTEARIIARKAALDFLDADHRSGLWMSVFTIDRRMRLLQQFTTDRDLVRAAVDRATGAAHAGRTDLTAEATRVGRDGDAATAQADAAAAGIAAAGAGAGGAGAAAGAAARDAAFAQIEQNTLDMTDRLERQLQGESSIFAPPGPGQPAAAAGRPQDDPVLLRRAAGHRRAWSRSFRSAVSEANRANVSIYAVDARGLITANQLIGQQQRVERSRSGPCSGSRCRAAEWPSPRTR